MVQAERIFNKCVKFIIWQTLFLTSEKKNIDFGYMLVVKMNDSNTCFLFKLYFVYHTLGGVKNIVKYFEINLTSFVI